MHRPLVPALLIVLVLAAPAAAADFVGMYSDDLFFGSGAYRTATLGSEVAVGVQLVREPFDWRRIETSPGVYDFRSYDDLVLRTAALGVHVLPVLGDPPPFRTTGFTADDLWSPPSSNADFAAFAARLVERYGPGGTLWAAHPEVAPLPIRSWQIWNEPNLIMYWNTGPDPAAYTRLLRAAHDAIHAVDPGAEVVAAGLPNSHAGTPVDTFLGGMFAAGAQGAFEAMAIHAYAADAAGSLKQVETMRSLLTAYGSSAPIWITEVGWPTGGPASPYTVSEAGQAQNLRDLFTQLAARRTALGIRGVVVFRWRDAVASFDAWPLHAGLLRADGSAKPGLAAFRDGVAALTALPEAVAPAPEPVGGGSPGRVAVARPRVAILGGELSRFGFLRVHMSCSGAPCAGRLSAGASRGPCSGQRPFRLGGGSGAVLRLRLLGKRRQLRGCRHVLVTARMGPDDAPAAAFLPKRMASAVR